MLKSIFTQIWNRKQSNSWVVLELLLVFCLIWFMVDYFFVLGYNYNIPNYRDTNHTWQVNLLQYVPEHPSYKAEENEPEAMEANYNRILQRLQNYQAIEAVSVAANGATPGSGSYEGTTYRTNDTTSVGGQKIRIDLRYDFFRVFAYTSDKGKKAVSVPDFDWKNAHAIVVSHSVAAYLFPNGSAIGQEIGIGREGEEKSVIIGVVDDIKRFHYQRPQHAFYVPERFNPIYRYTEISIRSSASIPDAVFQETFKKEMTNVLQVGNFYLKDVISYNTIGKEMDSMFGLTNNIRIHLYLMIFFLLNILLCVLGTFWYRINVRREEIGLRKALGANRQGIRNTLLLEGLCLLTIAFLPAMLIEYQFVRADLIETLGVVSGNTDMLRTYLPDRTMLRFLITNADATCDRLPEYF
ncbi:ABC transporter permease [Bacteroidia bacterium]|nr:ABC transporter permease [Bacteroidia bacterium]